MNADLPSARTPRSASLHIESYNRNEASHQHAKWLHLLAGEHVCEIATDYLIKGGLRDQSVSLN